ncbi:MAG: CoA transferase [Chloroflexi bacterium]|nr:CoA transferase [Chloroflexota bacterium]MCI0824285.1 CoA transferase [Chloroflexota bacterium]
MPDMALAGIRVLDFTQYVAGPYCTKLLADYGADVIKVERPGQGDGARRMGPFPGDIPHPEMSGLFLHLNTNKKGITLDLKQPAARNIALQLVKEVDLVVESFRPGTMDAFGLGYDALRGINPQLVMASISNFGQTGPYRDFRLADIMVYGMGGEMCSTGLEEREPIKLGDNVLLYQAGATASVATMGALYMALEQGIGQQVDVSIIETQIGSIDRRMSQLIAYQYTGDTTGRTGAGMGGYPSDAYPCEDGYLQVSSGGRYFPRIASMLGDPEFLNDPKWQADSAQADPGLKEEFEAHFLSWTLQRSKTEAWHVAQDSRVLSAPLYTMEEVARDPVLLERGAFADIDHPVAGQLRYPGRPFIMDQSPWAVRHPAPLLGQHNQEVLLQLGYSREDIVLLRQQGAI